MAPRKTNSQIKWAVILGKNILLCIIHPLSLLFSQSKRKLHDAEKSYHTNVTGESYIGTESVQNLLMLSKQQVPDVQYKQSNIKPLREVREITDIKIIN